MNTETPSFTPTRIVAVSDASSAAENAAWRAALLARERAASLRLVHVLRPRAARADGGDALAWELQERVGVPVEAADASAWSRRQLGEALADADLLVTSSVHSRPLRRWLRGVQPLQLLERGRVPVLVVRRPAAVRHARVLAAIGDPSDAAAVLATAATMAGGDFASVRDAVCIACAQLETRGGTADERYRAEQRLRAAVQDALKEQGARSCEAPMVALHADLHGLLQCQRQVLSDLLVLAAAGTAARALRALLRQAASDVLLVPGGRGEPHAVQEDRGGGAGWSAALLPDFWQPHDGR